MTTMQAASGIHTTVLQEQNIPDLSVMKSSPGYVFFWSFGSLQCQPYVFIVNDGIYSLVCNTLWKESL